ncbi:GldL-related protein [Psychroserpens sp. MEBiC05023]
MKNIPSKTLTLPLRLALIILIYGALFKVMHWPYANTLMLYGSVAIAVFYTIRFLNKKEKIRLDYIKLGLVLLWVFNYLTTIFHLFKLPYILEIILLIVFVWWLVEEGVSYFTNRELKSHKVIKFIYYTFLMISVFLIISGVLFKVMHWPYGNIMLTLGILLFSIFLIVDYFAIKKPSTNVEGF